MTSPLACLCRGLLATLVLACLAGEILAQAAPGGTTPAANDGAADGTVTPVDQPVDPRAADSAGFAGGGAVGSGPAGDVVKGGDSGGQDLPPNNGDDETDDDFGDADDGDDSAGDDTSDGGGAPPAAGIVMVMQVTLTDGTGVVVRTIHLSIERRGGRTVIVGATSVTQPRSSRLIR